MELRNFLFYSDEEKALHNMQLYTAIGAEVYDFFDTVAIKNGYELRDGQMDMACEIVDALKNNKHFMVEAGVGIGKSFAYIIVALAFIKRFKSPVIIATSTIALQEQLKDDIEKVKKMTGFDTEVFIAKGQSHFLCQKRSEEYFLKNIDNSEMKSIYEVVRKYGRERADWVIDIPESIWNKINVQNYNPKICRKSCPYLSKCYYDQLRSVIKDTKGIIVCNQDLLTVDLENRANYRNEIMNPLKGLIIIDEAHNLEGKVRSSLTNEIKKRSLEQLLNAISKAGIDHPDINKNIESARIALEYVYNGIFQQLQLQDKKSENTGHDVERYHLYATNNTATLANALNNLYDIVEIEMSRAFDDRKSQFLEELFNELETYTGFFESFSAGESSDDIFWAQKKRNNINDITLYSCPKHVSKIVKKYFFSTNIPVILTSATLTSNHSYDYLASCIGFDLEKGCLGEEKPSPFNYDEHSLIFYSNNLPHPTKEHDAFVEEGIELIKQLLEITNGKTLILFTSKIDMRAVYEKLMEFDLPYDIFMQEGNTKQKETLNRFRCNKNSVLLGTGSYWEGINVEGDSLSQVIIFRLPFPTPDPIIDYKSKQTSNGLLEVLVPEMIIKLKQGIGRLIRSEADKGIISIIDPRLGSPDNSYKDIILNSIPIKNKTDRLETLKEFYNSVCKAT